MPIMEIKIMPIGTHEPSISKELVPALKVLENKPDVRYELTSMGTIVEADTLERLYEIAAQMHKAALSHVDRVVTCTEIDDRKDKDSSMREKVGSLQTKLGK